MPSVINFFLFKELFVFLFGLFLGSFFGVLVDRLTKGESILKGRSHCDRCKKELGVLDLIPILSFVFLKGKCRFCKAELSPFYPIIELTTGTLFVATYTLLNFQFSISNFQLSMFISLFYYLFMVSSFIVIFFTDLKYGIIPDKIVLPAILVTFLWLIINQQLPARIATESVADGSIANHLLSAAGAFIFFVVISYVFFVLTKKQGMGGGDIKLSFLLGLFLGFPAILLSLYLAFLTGAFISIILILWKKKAFLKDSLPFGPFLISGAIISLFWGNYIYPFALNLLGI